MKLGTVVLALSLAVGAWADDVYLRGGGRVRGMIVERSAETIVLEVGPGRVAVPANRVERIVEAAGPIAQFRERAARLEPDDLEGWLALGHWARERELLTQARQAFQRAAAIDPDNAAAQRALGNVRHGDRWVTPEESFRARGLVPFEGSWLTPAERDEAVRARSAISLAEQARAEAEARVREAEARARAAEAEARRAEAELQQQDSAPSGIPLYWGLGYGPVVRPVPHPVRSPQPPCGPGSRLTRPPTPDTTPTRLPPPPRRAASASAGIKTH